MFPEVSDQGATWRNLGTRESQGPPGHEGPGEGRRNTCLHAVLSASGGTA